MTALHRPLVAAGGEPPDAPAVELVDVVKTYGAGDTEVRALAGVSLAVRPGELVAVMGPSGCGKSTLLHVAAGLERPTAGTVRVHGVDLVSCDATSLAALRRRSLGIVFQQLNLVPSLTAIENVMLPLELDGTPVRAARRAAGEALERVGVHGRLDRFPDECSGGQQQRIAIARSIVGDRSLVLADEPTGALDTITADSIVELLASLAADGVAVVLVTHEPRFASWADRVVFLRDGAIVDRTGGDPR